MLLTRQPSTAAPAAAPAAASPSAHQPTAPPRYRSHGVPPRTRSSLAAPGTHCTMPADPGGLCTGRGEGRNGRDQGGPCTLHGPATSSPLPFGACPYRHLLRSFPSGSAIRSRAIRASIAAATWALWPRLQPAPLHPWRMIQSVTVSPAERRSAATRSEEHTSELQSLRHLV